MVEIPQNKNRNEEQSEINTYMPQPDLTSGVDMDYPAWRNYQSPILYVVTTNTVNSSGQDRAEEKLVTKWDVTQIVFNVLGAIGSLHALALIILNL